MNGKFIVLSLMIGILICACSAEMDTTVAESSDENASAYDSALAAEVGADEYGMSRYVMAFLKRGPNRSQDSLEAAELQKAHLDNIGRLVEEGKLSLAGPFLDDGEVRGIYIFNVSTIEEARALTETDPAIQAGRLLMDLHPWYGSAAVKKIPDLHKQLQKTEF